MIGKDDFLGIFLCCAETFQLFCNPIWHFFGYYSMCYLSPFQKNLCLCLYHKVFARLSSSSFEASDLILWCFRQWIKLIKGNWNYLWKIMVRDKNLVSFIYVWQSSFPSTIYKRSCLPSNVCFWKTFVIKILYLHRFISGSFVLFHWFSCLFLWPY